MHIEEKDELKKIKVLLLFVYCVFCLIILLIEKMENVAREESDMFKSWTMVEKLPEEIAKEQLLT